MATLTPTASAMHQQYVNTYNKWLKTHYPDQYGNWVNRGPKRRAVKKWGGKIGTLALLYEGLKEVFDTGSIPTDMEEREGERAGVINKFVIDTTPKIIYKDGLAVGFEAPKGSDVDLSRYIPYQAAKAEATEPMIPESDQPQLEWIDPMDEWWPAEKNIYDTEQSPRFSWKTPFRAAKEVYEGVKYVTPPEIREKIAETTAFVSGGAYKLKK